MRNPLKFLAAHPKSPDYTVKQFAYKGVSFLIACFGMDLASARIGWYDYQVWNGFMSGAEAHGVYYAWCCVLVGLFFGLALFRIMEMYWFGKDLANKLRSPMEV